MDANIDRLIDREQIDLLLAIDRAKTFSGAALALGVSQPSISQRVKRLEALAGRSLFRRTRQGVELSSDGEAIIIYGRAMMALTHDLRRQLSHTIGRVQISVGLAKDFLRSALPVVLWLFARDHPHVDLRVVSGRSAALRVAVETRAVDFAVAARSSSLGEGTNLWIDERVWCGRADWPLPIADPIALVMPATPSPMREIVFETLKAAGRTWHVRFEGVGVSALEAALEAGLGISARPRHLRLSGVVNLDAGSGLPPLPPVEYAMLEPPPGASDTIRAFAGIIRQAAMSSFRRPADL